MPTVHVTVHPRGLHPTEAVRAWHLHVEEGMGIRDVCDEVVNMLGQRTSYKAVWRAIQGVKAVHGSYATKSDADDERRRLPTDDDDDDKRALPRDKCYDDKRPPTWDKCRTTMLDWGGGGPRAASYSINNIIMPE